MPYSGLHYYRLLWQVSEALLLMEGNNYQNWDKIKEILQKALIRTEEELMEGMITEI